MIAEVMHKIAEFESDESHPYSPRPSLAGPQRCIRSLDYYAQDYERKPFPGRFITVLDDSSWHEYLIKDWIRKSAFQVHSEQMEVICGTVNGRPMKGHIDGIVTDMLGVDRLLEIKALSHFGFLEIWNGHLPLDYITQTFLYIKGLREINPEINQAILLIKNKNQAQYVELSLEYDPSYGDGRVSEMVLSTGERKEINQVLSKVVELALERFEEVEHFKSEKKLHDRPYEKDHWRCQYCPYGELCWSTWEEEFAAMETDITLDQDAEDLCRYYKEAAAHVTEMEKEKDELKAKIKALLKQHNASSAQAGSYKIVNRLQSKLKVDESLIPPAILERAKTKITFEVLNVTARKGAKQ